MLISRCERCGRQAGESWDAVRPRLFIGGGEAVVCDPCRADVDQAVRQKPFWDRYVEITSRTGYMLAEAHGGLRHDGEDRYVRLVAEQSRIEADIATFVRSLLTYRNRERGAKE